jgi:hypothetical protein
MAPKTKSRDAQTKKQTHEEKEKQCNQTFKRSILSTSILAPYQGFSVRSAAQPHSSVPSPACPPLHQRHGKHSLVGSKAAPSTCFPLPWRSSQNLTWVGSAVSGLLQPLSQPSQAPIVQVGVRDYMPDRAMHLVFGYSISRAKTCWLCFYP